MARLSLAGLGKGERKKVKRNYKRYMKLAKKYEKLANKYRMKAMNLQSDGGIEAVHLVWDQDHAGSNPARLTNFMEGKNGTSGIEESNKIVFSCSRR